MTARSWLSLILAMVFAGETAGDPGDGVPFTVANPASSARHGEGLTCGIPLPKGFVRNTDNLALYREDGSLLPAQFQAADTYADGSPRWVLVDFETSLDPGQRVSYRLGRRSSNPAVAAKLTYALEDGVAAIDTGAATFRVDTRRFRLLDSAKIGGSELLADDPGKGVVLEDAEGRKLSAAEVPARAEFEDAGPLRVVLCVRGQFGAEESPPADYVCRMHFRAGKAEVRVFLTVRNPSAHQHDGNIWDLGARGSVFLEDLSIVLPLARSEPWQGAVPHELQAHRAAAIRLYQDSSGGENWRSANHIDKDYGVPVSFRGYRIESAGRQVASGNRDAGWLLAEGKAGVVAVALREFWQNFPKALELSDNRVRIALWPREYAGVHELQGGEQKTHEMLLSFHGPDADLLGIEARLRAFHEPLYAMPDPAAVLAAGTFWPTAPLDREQYSRLEATCDADVVATSPDATTIQTQWERIDEFGWRHFGDTFADNERAPAEMIRDFPEHHIGRMPISHFVNEYDVIATLMLQGLRREDPRWLWMADVMSRHHADICIYHTDHGAPAYAHGPFMHTTHETAAYRSTFRTYPIEAKRYGLRYGRGGGPNAGHTYVECLAHHYRLTGDRVSREAFLEVADWAADGPWFAPSMMGDTRGYGNFLATFVQAYQLTRDRKYYDRAMTLVGWIKEPIEGLGGTLLAKAAGGFLSMKAEAGEFDDDYRRVQEMLLRIGDLYLELPESRWEGSLEQRCFHSEVLSTCYLHAPLDHPRRQAYYDRGRQILDEALNQFPGHYLPVKSWVMCFANTGAYLKAGQPRAEDK